MKKEMTEKQIRTQCYNMKSYDLHADVRRKNARDYYYANRDYILAYKKAKHAKGKLK